MKEIGFSLPFFSVLFMPDRFGITMSVCSWVFGLVNQSLLLGPGFSRIL